jgi:hypothetical protein
MAALALEELSPLVKDFPELVPAVDRFSALLNDSLDRIAEGLLLMFPEIVRPAPMPPPPKPKINGHRKVNGRGRPKAQGIKLLSAPESPEKEKEAPSPQPGEEGAWEPDSQQNVSRCKALLLEILRRAAHDWVLYRQHSTMWKRELAQDAFTWLFEEDEGHPYYRERRRVTLTNNDGEEVVGPRIFTSFLAVCETLDLDPDTVRERVKKMDARSIISSGRPPQTRRARPQEVEPLVECPLEIDVDVNVEMCSDDQVSKYESYGSVMTPAVIWG